MKKQWFTVTSVHPRVYAIAEFNHFESVISYLVLGDSESVLIDTGMGYEDIGHITSSLTHNPVRVLFTHAHWDHIGGMGSFDNLSLFDDPFEKKQIESGYRSVDIQALQQTKYFIKPFLPKSYLVHGVSSYHVLHHHDVIQCSPYSLQVLHTPGHTPGSVCYFVPEISGLFSGDTIYPGPLYAHLPESDCEAYFNSLTMLNGIKHTIGNIFPGHNSVRNDNSLIQDTYQLFLAVRAGKKKPIIQTKNYIEYTGNGISVLLSGENNK